MRFYLSLCLDQTARSLPSSGSTRAETLKESLVHLQSAKSMIATTVQKGSSSSPLIPRHTHEKSMPMTPSDNSFTTPESYFLHNGSTDQVSTVYDATSPVEMNGCVKPIRLGHRRHISSVSSAMMRPAPLRIQKKVAFESPVENLSEHGIVTVEEWNLLDSFPMPPVPSRCPSLSSSTTSEPDEDDDNSTNNDAYPAARSRKIFRDTLKQFETHIDWHIAAIDEQLSKLTQNTLHTSVESTQPSTGSEFLDRVRRRRQEGWAERKRFNPKRYQDLREKALEEVDGQLRLTGSE